MRQFRTVDETCRLRDLTDAMLPRSNTKGGDLALGSIVRSSPNKAPLEKSDLLCPEIRDVGESQKQR